MRDTLSFRQLAALLWCALLAPAAELLPGAGGKLGALAVPSLAAVGAVLAASGLLCARAAGASGLARGLLDSFGRPAGTVVLLIYMVWGELLLVLRLALASRRLLGAGERDGTLWFFLAVLAAMALWMSRGRLGAVGRTAELMFLALAVTGGAVLLLALPQTRGINLLPRTDWSARSAAEAALPGLEAFSWGVFAPFLFQQDGERHTGAWLRWTALGCLALAGAELVILGNFGAALTGLLEAPFFQLAKSVGVEGAFQRVESVVSALWTFSDLCLLSGILWMMRRGAEALRPGIGSQTAAAAVLPAAGTRPWVLDELRRLLPAGGAVLGLAVPLLAVLLGERRGTRG